MADKKCEKCKRDYPKKKLFCPYCGQIDNRRADQIRSLEIKAKHHPEIGLRCVSCGSIFPDDQVKCPFCGVAINSSNAKSLSQRAPGDIQKLETPISKYYSGQHVSSTTSTSKNSNNQRQPTIQCVVCGRKISTKTEICPECGHPTGIHVCPKCGGVNTRLISGASKATSIFLWGPFAANKVLSKFQCKDCGHKF